MLSTLLFIYTLILRTISRRGERRCVLEIHSTYVDEPLSFSGTGTEVLVKP